MKELIKAEVFLHVLYCHSVTTAEAAIDWRTAINTWQ